MYAYEEHYGLVLVSIGASQMSYRRGKIMGMHLCGGQEGCW